MQRFYSFKSFCLLVGMWGLLLPFALSGEACSWSTHSSTGNLCHYGFFNLHFQTHQWIILCEIVSIFQVLCGKICWLVLIVELMNEILKYMMQKFGSFSLSSCCAFHHDSETFFCLCSPSSINLASFIFHNITLTSSCGHFCSYLFIRFKNCNLYICKSAM